MHRVLSWKRLLVVVGVFVVFSATAYGVFRVQSKRHAAVLKARAEKEIEAAGGDPAKTDEAVALYARYLKYNPRDEAAYTRYAGLMLDRAKTDPKKAQAAADALHLFLRQFPDHADERRQLIDLYIRLGLFNTARENLEMMFAASPEGHGKDPELLDRSATCALVTGGLNRAVQDLDKAIETGKAPVKTFERILGVLHDNPSFRDPRYSIDKYIEKLTTQEPYRSSIPARVAAGRFKLVGKQYENARTYINYALNDMVGGASDPDALLAGAELALIDAANNEKVAAERMAAARKYLEKAFALDPKDVRIGILYADSLAADKDRAKTIDVLRQSAAALGEPNDQFLRVVDRLLDYGETEQSTKLIDRLATNDQDRVRVAKYFRGRLAVIKKEWPQARTLLEEVAPVLIRVPEFHKKALTDLAQCYGTFQNPDKQLEFARAALKDDASYLPAIVAEAEALSRLGKVREAMPKYRVVVIGHKLEQYRPTLVRLEYITALLQPAGVRNWAKFEEAMGPPEKRTPEINVIYAEALAARGEQAAAMDVLRGVLKADPKNGAALMALARGRGDGRPEAVLATLEKAKAEYGDSLDMRLAIASVLPYRTKRPKPDEFRALADGAEGHPKPDRYRLWFGLGEATMRAAAANADEKDAAAMRDLSVEFFEKAARSEQLDLIARAILIDLGLAAGNKDLVDRSLKEIEGIEGAKGPIGTLGRVAAKLPEARDMTDKPARTAAIKALRDDAKKVREIRPLWSRIYIALAQLDEAEGLFDSALGQYAEAIEKGDRQEFVVRRAVELYRERKKDDEAAAMLNRLAAEMNLPDDLERFRLIKDLLARDLPRSAAPTIDRIAPANSTDYRIRLLRGALLAAVREDKEAEAAFRAAVAVGDHLPETWTALITHLARQQKGDEAKDVLKEAEVKLRLKMPANGVGKGEILVALAGCHEIVGDLKTAGERYQQAVEAAPQELSLHKQWVRFLQRHGHTAAATEWLTKMIDSPAQDLVRWGRRTMAMSLLVGRKAYFQRFNALNLIDQNLKEAPSDAEDIKARAVVQTIDPATRDEGIKTLRDYALRLDLTPEEYYLLARMYFDQGKLGESVEYFKMAARPQPGVTLQHLSGLIRCYLALNQVNMAVEVLERMKTAAPAAWDTAREEAIVLNRQGADADRRGNKDEAKKLREQARTRLLQYPGRQGDTFVARELGPALEELGFLEDAEVAYTRLLNTADGPAPHLPLCVFLINQKRTEQAIKLAKAHDTAKTPVVVTAQLLSGAVRAKNPGGADEAFVGAWIDEKLRAFQGKPELPALVAAKAELFDAQEKYDDAIREYKRAIEIDAPDNSDVVKNNLATLIALHKPAEVDSAIKMMTDLIGIRGPAPAYLDTRAVAYLVKGTPKAAVDDLELALAQHRKPLYLFHLGWAFDLIAEKQSQSGKMLDEAKKLGMTGDLLHPLELKKFGPRYGLRGK